jgi:tryptophanyl-tRNA synthetase
MMATSLIQKLAPIQQRRREHAGNIDAVWDILEDGSRKARETAKATMEEVRAAMNLSRPRPPTPREQ